MATAAAAEAAVAAAQAAAKVVRLAGYGRQSKEDRAATLIQSHYRGYLVRRFGPCSPYDDNYYCIYYIDCVKQNKWKNRWAREIGYDYTINEAGRMDVRYHNSNSTR